MKNTINKQDGFLSGIYKITNLITKDFYLGCTKCFIDRYRSHLCSLKSGKSNCIKLQAAVIKYGLDNFEFSILEICENYEEKEYELLNSLKPRYNLVLEQKEKRILSDETRKRMSDSAKGRKAWNKGLKYKSNRIKKKSVRSINSITLEAINHNSVQEARDHFNFCTITAIYQCCTNIRNNVKGIKFQYIT